MSSIRKEDIVDNEIVDAIELSSDGYYSYLSTSIVSTGPNVIINMPSDGFGILYTSDHPVESGDRVYLTGTSGADGYYIVNSVLTDLSFSVTTSIASSTGGTIYFMHPSGASKVGFDGYQIGNSNLDNLQDAIKYIYDFGISDAEHSTLRQLIHFIDEGPGDGFASGAYKETLGFPFTNSIIWYTDNTKTQKIVSKIIVRNISQMPTSITWEVYNTNGITVAHTIIDTITYTNNVFETSRTRSIS